MTFLFVVERFVSYLLYFMGIYWISKKYLERRGTGVVLVYHRVLAGRRTSGEMVGEAAFDWQMKYLKEHCAPFDWLAQSGIGDAGKRIRVMVTFDDGHRDNFTRALPIMNEHGVPGVFFLVTNFVFARQRIGADGTVDKNGGDQGPTEEELAVAEGSGWITFGNHTASHRIVSGLDAYELDRELAESQNAFRERLGVLPELFAYPRGRSGDVSKEAIPILEKHGFKAAFTMIPGRVTRRTDPYFVPRIGVSHVNDRIVFKVKIIGLLSPLVKLKNLLGA
jgi:peptidoglycan/xylan/chitin deacetylase (PgdA/CDA1 family)